MLLSRSATIAAGFAIMVSPTALGKAVPLELNPEHAPEPMISLAKNIPQKAFYDRDLNTKSFIFEPEATKEKVTFHGAAYDMVLKMACPWTVSFNLNAKKEIEGDVQIEKTECAYRSQPAAWNTYTPKNEQDGKFDQKNLDQGRVQNSVPMVLGNLEILQIREWKYEENRVCLKTAFYTSVEKDENLFTVNHGCFVLDRRDFMLKYTASQQPIKPT